MVKSKTTHQGNSCNRRVTLFVEGGGDSSALQIECRKGFREFLEKAGFKGKMPSITACGGRAFAYKDYCTAIANGESSVLLVDSEATVAEACQQGIPTTWLPWEHLKQRQGDGWDKPEGGQDTDCHLMVQIMESWFLADRDILISFFNNGFKEGQLPAISRPIESLPKADVYAALQKATADCKTKVPYGKGEHSFKILAKIDPNKVIASSSWARRFVDELKKKMDANKLRFVME